MCIIWLIWTSRISFDPWDSRKFFGLITCGSCGAWVRHSASLHTRVILDGARCAGCTGCSRSCSCCTDLAACCVVEGRVNEEVLVVKSRWDNQGWDMEHTRWQDSFQAHKDDNAIPKPSALCVRSALVNKLYCTDVYCECVSCLQVLSSEVPVPSPQSPVSSFKFPVSSFEFQVLQFSSLQFSSFQFLVSSLKFPVSSF